MRPPPHSRLAVWLAMLCLLLIAGGGTWAAEPKKIVLVAGAPSHPSGMHEFRAGCLLFQSCLQGVPGLSVQVCSNGWPTQVVGGVTVDDNTMFEDAAAVLIYCDGGSRHPANRPDRVAALDALVARGAGLGFLHYALEVPNGDPANAMQRWVGGHYEHLYSVNPMWTPHLASLPVHPVAQGVQPFTAQDEWYFSLRWIPDTNVVFPIVLSAPSDDVRDGPYVFPVGPYPHVVAASGRAEPLVWVLDRTNGHRGFGFTGGHRHANWGQPDQLKIVLNALLWLARMEVPVGGVPAVVSPAQLLENLDSKGNHAPQLSPVLPQATEVLKPVSLKLVATDPNFPTQSLSYSLDSGPPGLTVSPGGLLTWTPSEAQAGGMYSVTVRVTDTGTPVMSDTETFNIEVASVLRTAWLIGSDDSPTVSPYNPHGEFSNQNGRNDARPGGVTRVPGDPEYDANPVSNPAVDDDFYFAGAYPAGFNGLAAPRIVPSDEPALAWERGHTEGDRTNRFHVMLGAAQTSAGSRFRLTLEFATGGYSVGGVTQPGFGSHTMVVRFRNGAGVVTDLRSQSFTAPGTLTVEFTPEQVSGGAGANTIEIVRTNPSVAGRSSWIRYDFVRLEALAPANTAPSMVTPGDRGGTPLIPLTFLLQSTDADLPAQALTHTLVSGPSGMTVSPGGLLAWTPSEVDAGASVPVTVRVTDAGTPPMSDTQTFTLQVAAGLRAMWSIGADDSPAVSPYNPHGEFSNQNGRNDARPGGVTRVPGDPVYDANPLSNPPVDDDFYFAGDYPAGFNSLGVPLRVPMDEPATAWERGHTEGDRTNRIHWVLGAAQTGSATRFRLTLEFATGGYSVGGVTQPGFGSHTMVVRFRNAAGLVTVLRTQTLTAPTTLLMEFDPAQVSAVAGANSIEIVRTNPSVAGTSSWIRYDFVRLEALPVSLPGALPGPILSAAADSGYALQAIASREGDANQQLSIPVVSEGVVYWHDAAGPLGGDRLMAHPGGELAVDQRTASEAGEFKVGIPGDHLGNRVLMTAKVLQPTPPQGFQVLSMLTEFPGLTRLLHPFDPFPEGFQGDPPPEIGPGTAFFDADGSVVFGFRKRLADGSEATALGRLQGGTLAVLAQSGVTPVPGTGAPFSWIGRHCTRNGTTLFYGEGEGRRGVYQLRAGGLTKVLESGDPAPDGSARTVNILSEQACSFDTDGPSVAIATHGPGSTLYRRTDGQWVRVAGAGDAIPGGIGNFFEVSSPTIRGDRVLFLGGRDNPFALPRQQGLYRQFGTSLERVADLSSDFGNLVPGAFEIPAVGGRYWDGTTVAFRVVNGSRDLRAVFLAAPQPQGLVLRLDPAAPDSQAPLGFSFPTVPEAVYEVQTSIDLSEWTEFRTLVGDGNPLRIEVPRPSSGLGYIRVLGR